MAKIEDDILHDHAIGLTKRLQRLYGWIFGDELEQRSIKYIAYCMGALIEDRDWKLGEAYEHVEIELKVIFTLYERSSVLAAYDLLMKSYGY